MIIIFLREFFFFFHIGITDWLIVATVYSSSKQPDLVPRPTVSFECDRNNEEDLEKR